MKRCKQCIHVKIACVESEKGRRMIDAETGKTMIVSRIAIEDCHERVNKVLNNKK